jgi:hypothetical protein
MALPPRILDPHQRNLLRAALGDGASATAAYRAWRAGFDLDIIDGLTFRIMPLLLRTAERLDVPELELARMRGVGKHIWLSNVLGMRLLVEAIEVLQRAPVDAILMKGGALFARDTQLSHLRYSGDYDLQIRKRDAPRAISALRAAGFQEDGIQAHRFTQADFELIHAVHLVKQISQNSIDLHWRPLPRLRDEAFVDELLAFRERGNLFGREVAIPGAADHLFLCVSRPELWEANEIFLRAVEATQLLRHCGGKLDWDRFEDLAERYRSKAMAAAMLRLIRDEVGAPVPERVMKRLWRRAGMAERVEWSLRRTPPFDRNRRDKFVLSAFDIARSRPNGGLPALFLQRRLRSELIRSAKEQFGKITDESLTELWKQEAARDSGLLGEITFAKGFSFPEAEGRWTDGELSVLLIPVEAASGALLQIKLFVRPFLPHPNASFSFDVTGGVSVDHHRLTRDEGVLVEVSLTARVIEEPTRRLALVFRHRNPGCPLEMGLSEDPRRLGLFIRDIELPEVIQTFWPRYAARETHFNSPEPLFTRGFAAAEAGGRWTDGHLAVLEVPVESSAGPAQIRLTVRPFIPRPDAEFAFSIDAGFGFERYSLNHEQSDTTEIAVNARVVGDHAKKSVLVFDLPDCRSPCAFELSGDQRLLGLFIEKVEPRDAAEEQAIQPASAPQ